MEESAKCPKCGARLVEEGAKCRGCLLLGGLADAETETGEPEVGSGNGRADQNLVGKQIGAYTVVERVGEGGTAEVFRARQSEPVERDVAFKLIKPGMDSDRVVARFDAERQVLARLQHPNIATVLDAGNTDDGRPFFVLEYVDGLPITDFATSRELDVRARIELVAKVCQAVHHAHQRGIVHRDLKPSNILVDASGEPKIIDFGIARALEDELSDTTLFLTREGEMLGTPAYMSPEQALGEIGEIDTRTDIYSLGIVSYELLTGSLPFEQEDITGGGLVKIQKLVTETVFQRPSSRSITTQVPSSAMRGDLDWIVMKALEKEKGRRYDSASAMAEDIGRHLRSEPVSAGPPTRSYRLKKFIRRNRGLAAGLCIASIGLLAGTGVSVWQAARAKEAQRLAQQQAEVSQAVNDFLVDDLLGGVDFDFYPEPDITLQELIDRAAKTADERFKGMPLASATVEEAIGDVYMSVARYEDAEEHLRAAREGYRAVKEARSARGSKAEAILLRKVSHALAKLGRRDEAKAAMDEAVAIATAAGVSEADLLEWRFYQVGYYTPNGAIEEGYVAELKEISEGLRAAKGADDFMARQADYHYALALCKLGRTEEAVPKLDAYLAALDPESDASPRAQAMKEIAEAYQKIGRMAEAEELLKGALEIQQRRGRHDHPDTLIMREALAMLYSDTGRMELATPIYEGLIGQAMEAGGEISPVMLHVISNHASNLVSTDPQASLEYFEIAYAGRNEKLGESHVLSLETAHNYSIGLFQAGQKERGSEILERVVADLERIYSPGHPETMGGRLLLARMLSDRGLVDEAIAEEVKMMRAGVPEDVGLRRQSLEYREAARAALRARDLKPDRFVHLEAELLERDPSEEGAWGSLAQALFDRYRGTGELDDLRTAVLCLSATGDGRRRGLGAALIPEWCTNDPAAADIAPPRAAVPEDAVWAYQEQTPADTGWRGRDFDASGWPSGKGKFGYGDGDEVTEIGFGGDPANKWISACFRLEFEYDPAVSGALSLGIVYDDGVVVYLDGREVVRSLMPAGEILPETLAVARYTSIKEGIEEPFLIAPEAFAEGSRHTLAVQVHQTSPGSSDLAFKLRAIGAMPSREIVAEKIPDSVLDEILAPEGKAISHLRAQR